MRERVTVVVLCVSVFSILPSCAFRRPTRGISSYSAENAVKLENVEHCGGKPEQAANMHMNRQSFTLK